MAFIAPSNDSNTKLETAQVKNNISWLPDFEVADFKNEKRLDHTTSDKQISHHLKAAMFNINRQLQDYTAKNKVEFTTEQLFYYREAVFHHARARLLEEYRDYDSTNAGIKNSDDLAPRILTEWTGVRTNIRSLVDKNRWTVELL